MKLVRYQWLYFLLFILGFVVLATLPRTAFPLFVAVFTAVFLLYGNLVFTEFRLSLATICILFFAVRLPFFFELPQLSDDYFRFLWDGMLINEGFNPFGRIPIEERLSSFKDPIFAQYLLDKMNSPGYGSVYPTFHQIIFGFSYFLSGAKVHYGVNTMRAFIVLTELAFLIYTTFQVKDSKRFIVGYLLNPLVVVEGLGNLHFEAIMVPWLAVSLYSFDLRLYLPSAVSFAGSVLVKLNPLILLPAYVFRKGFSNRFKFLFSVGLILFLFIGMLEPWKLLGNLESGFGLYFTQFEFNASTYYLLREAFASRLGYNPIGFLGPALGLISLCAIVLLSYRYRRAELNELVLVVYLVFLMLSTTVHPWYVLPVVYLAVASGRPLLLLWSCTAIFSYSHYVAPMGPKWIFIVAEYAILLGAFLFEAKRRPWLQGALRG